jgi:hypothetical protein
MRKGYFPEFFQNDINVNCKEDYDNLKLACKPIFQKINTLCEKASIEVEGKHFDLDILMGGDIFATCAWVGWISM